MNLNRWKPYNPNPVRNQRVGDCAIRAICKATGQDWETAFAGVMVVACEKSDMPSANSVWGTYLSFGETLYQTNIQKIIPWKNFRQTTKTECLFLGLMVMW